jgi:putative acetyltransferase
MHILAERRGEGLSRRMLHHLVNHALAEGFSKLSLETGSQPGFAPARGLYAKAGFAECGPFEGYGPDPNSVFMTCEISRVEA